MKKICCSQAALLATLAYSPLAAAQQPTLTISGAVEVEAIMADDYAGDNRNDIVLATVAVAVDAAINDRVSAQVGFLHEEDETDFGLDTGTISLKMSDTATLSAGRMYVPFGSFESYMISDPFTLELGETSETALLFGIGSGKLTGAFYTFNGDIDEAAADDEGQLSFGGRVDYRFANQVLGAGYISNIADSDLLQEADPPGPPPAAVDSYVAGLALNYGIKFNDIALLAEYVTALRSFSNGDLGGAVTDEERPAAANLEAAFELNETTMLGVAYQMTQEADFLGLPEHALSVAARFKVIEGTAMGVEFMTMENYDGDTATALTAQLAVEF